MHHEARRAFFTPGRLKAAFQHFFATHRTLSVSWQARQQNTTPSKASPEGPARTVLLSNTIKSCGEGVTMANSTTRHNLDGDSVHTTVDDVDPYELSFQAMSLDRAGRIVTKEKKLTLREQYGYCMTCPGVPVLLFEIRKSRLNPLWSSKKPRTADGQCVMGRCVRCHPELHHTRKGKHDSVSRNSSGNSAVSMQSMDSVMAMDRGGGYHHQHQTAARGNMRRQSGLDSSSAHSSRSHQSGQYSVTRRSRNVGRTGSSDRIVLESNHSHGSNGDSRSISALDEVRRQRELHQQRSEKYNGRDPGRDHLGEYNRRQSEVAHESATSFATFYADDRSVQSERSHRSYQSDRSFRSHQSDRSYLSSSSGNYSRYRVADASSLSSRPHHPRPNSLVASSSRNRQNHGLNLRNQMIKKSLGESCRSLQSVEEESTLEETKAHLERRPSSSPYQIQNQSAHREPQPQQQRSPPSRSQSRENLPETIIVNLRELFQDMLEMNSSELMSEVLVNAMDSHAMVEQVQLLCVRTVTEVFQKLDAAPFIAANGHKRILTAMKNFHSSLNIQKEGCEALSALSVQDSTRAVLIRAGTCEAVNLALHKFLGDARLASGALKILRSISFEQEGSTALEKLDMSRTLVEVMFCNLPSAEIQRDGCALLSNLAVDVAKQRVSPVDKNAIAVAVAAIKEHADNPSVVASACFALKNLSHEESNLRSLSNIPSVLEVCYAATRIKEAEEDASIIMERVQMSMAQDQSLEEHSHNTLNVLMETRAEQPMVVAEIVNILKNYNWSEQVTSECVNKLYSLISQSDAHMSELAKERNVEQLRSCLETCSLGRQTQDEANRLMGLVNAHRSSARSPRTAAF